MRAAATVRPRHLEADAVREALDLDTLGRLLGVEPKSARGGLVRCPFHSPDRKPSFSLFPSARGGWAGRCHSCDAKGDGFKLVARHRGLDVETQFKEVLRVVAAELGLAPGVPRPKPAPRPAPPAPNAADLEERRAVQRAIHEVLLDVAPLEDEGRAYLRGRGFRDDETPGDLCLLPRRAEQRRVVEAIASTIGVDAWREGSGLASSDGTGFTFAGNRLVIPWPSAPGVQATVAMLQRRRIDANDSVGSKYVSPAEIAPQWPYGIENAELAGDETVPVFVEGALDVLALRVLAREHGLDWWPLGVPGVNWRPEWAELGAGRDCIVALDDDRAGEAVIDDIAADLDAAGARTVERRRPQHGKDWGETLASLRGGEDDEVAHGR